MKLILLACITTVAVSSTSKLRKFNTSDGIKEMYFIGSVEGKSFYFNKDDANLLSWEFAGRYCASMGMHLASIDTEAQYNLLKYNNDELFLKPHHFWTSARDSRDFSQLKWDDTNSFAGNSATYFEEELLDQVPTEYLNCMRLHKYTNRVLLEILRCEYANYPLCEEEI